jgi:hypothetical protein
MAQTGPETIAHLGVCWVHRIFKVACSLDSWACLNQKSWNFLFWIYFMAAFQDKIHFLPCWAFEHSHCPKRHIFHIIPLPPPPYRPCVSIYILMLYTKGCSIFLCFTLILCSPIGNYIFRNYLKEPELSWKWIKKVDIYFLDIFLVETFFSRYFFNILNTLIVHCHILFKNSICARPCRFWIH